MNGPLNNPSDLSLAPLGAGDLIDRAVRLYRRHFLTLIRIAAPPVLVSAVGSTLTTIAFRAMFVTSSDARVALYVLMLLAGFGIAIGGSLFSLIVMGGAARNLVAHLLWNEPVSFRTTYRAVKERFWALLGASVLVGVWIIFCFWIATTAFYIVEIIVVIGSVKIGELSRWMGGIIGGLGTTGAVMGAAIIFFLLVGHMAYVPQALLVEGKGVFAAVGRSFSLASGNARRLMAMTLFTAFATYSALMLLVIPLGWYGYLNGLDLSPFTQFESPAWYAIGYEVIWQCSHILLAPIWMLALSLMYVDERVRHEGYDIELMAARQLPQMPQLAGVMSPFAPALVTGRAPKFVPPPPIQPPTGSVLGLR
ncbi:MAG: hypothetical protein DMF71_10545 [Acidobacteria bacterium]|nr:MAG: hypothetical protein DMF71_10545 [Acidobacteriota bacterium]